VKGLHQPIIDKEIFDRVQMVLEEKLQAKGFVKAKSFRPQYPLRGLLLCGSCNGKLTASTSKGRKGKYAYYHCNHCGAIRLPVQKVDEKIENILGELKVNGSSKKLYELMVKTIFN